MSKALESNPYHPAFDEAAPTGESVAEFLIDNFKGYYINLVGFSLGTEVILHLMNRLAKRNNLGILYKVYLIGGAAGVDEFQQLLQAAPSGLTVINMYS
jgi:uncharacterized alpha/beta hydrolase family protein